MRRWKLKGIWMDVELTEGLKAYARQYVDRVGVASADAFRDAPEGWRPLDHLPGCRSVVMLCMKHLDVFARSLDKDCQAYTQDLTNRALSIACYPISRFLERKGYLAFPMDASIRMVPYRDHCPDQRGRIDLRRAAEVAGIGRIGKIAIVVTPEYGPRVQLAAILTDAALVPDQPFEKILCPPDCRRCIAVCPAGALRPPEEGEVYRPTDQKKCMTYRRTHGGSSPMGRGEMCSLCRAVCPVGGEG